MQPPQIKTSLVLTIFLFTVLGIIFLPMGLWALYGGVVKAMHPQPFGGGAGVPLGIGIGCLGLYTLILLLVVNAYRKSLKMFSEAGFTRNDGKTFAWNDLGYVVQRLNFKGGNPRTWRMEVHFRNGDSAWLRPQTTRNFKEVADYLKTLPCEQRQQKG